MRRASGRYLCSVDGDDFIDAAFLKDLLDASDRGASDLTVAGSCSCASASAGIPALPTCGIFLRLGVPLEKTIWNFPEGIHPVKYGLLAFRARADRKNFLLSGGRLPLPPA